MNEAGSGWRPLWSGSFILLTIMVITGCSPSTSTTPQESDQFFVNWLKNHGETNIVTDANGVGLAGSPTRLRWSRYETKESSNAATAELEFRIRLPDQREIVEFVAGMGATVPDAEKDAKLNFALTTFHVIYGGFLNPKDKHYAEEPFTNNSRPRLLVMGDTYTRGATTNSSPDMFPLRNDFRNVIAAHPFSRETHWIKIVYAQRQSNTILCSVTLDNQDAPALEGAFKNLSWPKNDEFYMVKQFIIVK